MIFRFPGYMVSKWCGSEFRTLNTVFVRIILHRLDFDLKQALFLAFKTIWAAFQERGIKGRKRGKREGKEVKKEKGI